MHYQAPSARPSIREPLLYFMGAQLLMIAGMILAFTGNDYPSCAALVCSALLLWRA